MHSKWIQSHSQCILKHLTIFFVLLKLYTYFWWSRSKALARLYIIFYKESFFFGNRKSLKIQTDTKRKKEYEKEGQIVLKYSIRRIISFTVQILRIKQVVEQTKSAMCRGEGGGWDKYKFRRNCKPNFSDALRLQSKYMPNIQDTLVSW